MRIMEQVARAFCVKIGVCDSGMAEAPRGYSGATGQQVIGWSHFPFRMTRKIHTWSASRVFPGVADRNIRELMRFHAMVCRCLKHHTGTGFETLVLQIGVQEIMRLDQRSGETVSKYFNTFFSEDMLVKDLKEALSHWWT